MECGRAQVFKRNGLQVARKERSLNRTFFGRPSQGESVGGEDEAESQLASPRDPRPRHQERQLPGLAELGRAGHREPASASRFQARGEWCRTLARVGLCGIWPGAFPPGVLAACSGLYSLFLRSLSSLDSNLSFGLDKMFHRTKKLIAFLHYCER